MSWGDAGEHANFWAMFVREHDVHPVNGWGYGLGIDLGQSEEVFFIQQPHEGWCTQEDVFGAAFTKEGSLLADFIDDPHGCIVASVVLLLQTAHGYKPHLGS